MIETEELPAPPAPPAPLATDVPALRRALTRAGFRFTLATGDNTALVMLEPGQDHRRAGDISSRYSAGCLSAPVRPQVITGLGFA